MSDINKQIALEILKLSITSGAVAPKGMNPESMKDDILNAFKSYMTLLAEYDPSTGNPPLPATTQ